MLFLSMIQFWPIFAKSESSSSPTDGLWMKIGVIVAVVAGVLVPLLLRWMDKRREEERKRQQRQEETERDLAKTIRRIVEEKIQHVSDSGQALADQITADIKSIQQQINEIDRAHLKQLTECQGNFVTMDTYKKDLSTQKYYYKIIYSMIQKQLTMLDEPDED